MDLTLFVIFITICLLFSFFELAIKKSVKLLDVIVFLFYVFLIATRSIDYSPDVETYIYAYNSLPVDNLLSYSDAISTPSYSNFEYGFLLLAQIIKMVFGENIIVFLGFFPIFNLLIAFYSVKSIIINNYNNQTKNEETDPPSSFLNVKNILFLPFFTIYVSYFGFLYSGVVLRQGVALSLILLAVSQVYKRKYILGLLFFFLSIFFHKTAIFAIGVFIIIFMKFSIKKPLYYVYIVVIFAFYLLKLYSDIAKSIADFLVERIGDGFILISSDKIDNYLGNVRSLSEYSLSIFASFLFSFFAIFLFDQNDKFQNKLLQLNLLATTLLSFLSGILAISRLTEYFAVLNIVLFYCLFIWSEKNKYFTRLVFILYVTIYSTMFYRMFTLY